MRYCTAVLLLFVEVMYSGTVVIMFSLGTQTWENKSKKNRNGTNVPDPGKLVHSSSVVAFQIVRVIRSSVVDIKRTVDMSPLKRIRLRSHAASELKANRSMRAREQVVFVLCLVLPMEAPQAPVPVSAQPNHWHDLLRFSL